MSIDLENVNVTAVISLVKIKRSVRQKSREYSLPANSSTWDIISSKFLLVATTTGWLSKNSCCWSSLVSRNRSSSRLIKLNSGNALSDIGTAGGEKLRLIAYFKEKPGFTQLTLSPSKTATWDSPGTWRRPSSRRDTGIIYLRPFPWENLWRSRFARKITAARSSRTPWLPPERLSPNRNASWTVNTIPLLALKLSLLRRNCFRTWQLIIAS